MGVMDVLKKIGNRKSEFKEKLKNAQEEDKINRLLEERMKSANQRELEKRLKAKQEEEYKMMLDKLRKEDTKNMWSSKKNNVLQNQKNILSNDRPILKERNIFLDNQTNIPFMKGECMFFDN